MFIGHKKLIKLFKRLADENKLSHAYLFFGEPQVGKFLFADSLANYLETRRFEKPLRILEETLILEPTGGVIGIDKARELINFLYQKPIFSKKRTVIIRDVENLTSEAQNAILKIVEEPPKDSLIILIGSSEDLLLPVLISRLQKVYFPRVSAPEIESFLISIAGKKFNREKITSIAGQSFGRPGRAMDLLLNKKNKKDEIVENDLDKFFESLIIDLYRDKYKNLETLKEVLKRLKLIKMFNVNKKLQLKAIGVWGIS